MIIERKHVPFWKLKQDDKEAFEIFDKAFNESYLTLNKQEKKRQYQMLLSHSLEERKMGWCFDKIGYVIEGFEKLDKEKPYDNGLDFGDVNKVYIDSRDTKSITLRLVSRYENVERLVKIVELGVTV